MLPILLEIEFLDDPKIIDNDLSIDDYIAIICNREHNLALMIFSNNVITNNLQGYVYVPYIPMMVTEPFNPRINVSSRYTKKIVKSKFFKFTNNKVI